MGGPVQVVERGLVSGGRALNQLTEAIGPGEPLGAVVGERIRGREGYSRRVGGGSIGPEWGEAPVHS